MRNVLGALKRFAKRADMVLLVLCIISAVFGLLLVASASRNTVNNRVFVQTVAIAIGVVLFIVFSLIDIDVFADRYIILIIAGLLFISSLFFFGVGEESTGNRAWLRFSFGFGIQPTELVKIPFIIVLARLLSRERDTRLLNRVSSMGRVLLVFILHFGLIIFASKDMGTALVYVFILLVMMYMGGVYLRWFLAGAAAVAAAAPLIWTKVLSDLQKKRILLPFDLTIDPTGMNERWQTNQSLRAIKNGGFFGTGLFKGTVTQSGLVPQQHTDFILSVAAEELGFAGVICVLLLLLLIIIRCIQIGVRSNDKLGLLVCIGVAAMLIAQTLENVGMVLGMTPVIGLTLPFFSYGGSSIISCFVAAGIVSGVKMKPKISRYN